MAQQPLVQGRRTNGTRDQNGTRKDFLGTRHSLLTLFFISSAQPASLYSEEYVCVCVAAYSLLMNYRRYQITLQ
jgi:hypothetical protein